MGVQIINAKKNATLKRIEKPPKTERTVSVPPVKNSRIGLVRTSINAGVAKYTTIAVTNTDTTTIVKRRRSSPRWSIKGMRAGVIGILIEDRITPDLHPPPQM